MEDYRVVWIWKQGRPDECIGVLVAARLEIVTVEAIVRVLQDRGMRTEILHQLDNAAPR